MLDGHRRTHAQTANDERMFRVETFGQGRVRSRNKSQQCAGKGEIGGSQQNQSELLNMIFPFARRASSAR